MAKGQRTKKQHFVPRFLLSQFADPTTGCIHIFDHTRAVPLPAQKPQRAFAKRFYYDNDNEVEDFLSREIEAPAAPVIRHLIEHDAKISDHDRVALVKFIGAQLGRTPAAREEAVAMVTGSLNLIAQQMLRANGCSEEDAKSITAVLNNPRGLHAWLIAEQSLSAFLFLDLAVAVLVNRTSVPFILSDHPVIQYNWYMRNASHLGALSMTAPGVQVIMPISASRCLLLYDCNVYDVAETEAGIVPITNAADVDLLNELQLRNRQRFTVASSSDQLKRVEQLGSTLDASSLVRFDQGLIENWRDTGDGTRRDLLSNHRVQFDVARWLTVSPVIADVAPPPTTFVHRDLDLLDSYQRLEKELRESEESEKADDYGPPSEE